MQKIGDRASGGADLSSWLGLRGEPNLPGVTSMTSFSDGPARLRLKMRKDSLAVLFPTALIAAQDFKLRLGSSSAFTRSLQLKETRLLLRELTLSFNDLAFELPQLFRKRLSVHDRSGVDYHAEHSTSWQ